MKLQVLSGLYLQFGGLHPPQTDADVIVLAGDIARGAAGLRWAAQSFDKPIVYVPGNHELHNFDVGVLEELRSQAQSLGIHFLDCGELSIDGVRFLGCTLWTDYDLFGRERREHAMKVSEQWIDDFQLMTDLGRVFTPERARRRHWQARGWLHERVLADHPQGPTVVVTHHAPYRSCLAPSYRDDLIAASHASDMSELFGHCELWIHGSGWGRTDATLGGTRLVCNSRGSPAEHGLLETSRSFAVALTIEVPSLIREMPL